MCFQLKMLNEVGTALIFDSFKDSRSRIDSIKNELSLINKILKFVVIDYINLLI